MRLVYSILSNIAMIGAVVSFACAQADPQSKSISPTKTCGQLMRQASSADRDAKCIATAGSLAVSRKGSLILKMDDGHREVFKNSGDEDVAAIYGYSLLDFYPTLHIFVVGYLRDDDSIITLVDGPTGRSSKLGSEYPTVSADGRWIITERNSNEELGPDLSIYEFQEGKLHKIWSVDAEKSNLPVGTIVGGWENDKTVRLELMNNQKRYLSHIGGSDWRLVDVVPHSAPGQ